jgi:hypothetical protein
MDFPPAWNLKNTQMESGGQQVIGMSKGLLGDILRKSRNEHIGSGLPQIATVNADVA